MEKRILILANNAAGLLSFRREVVEALVKSGSQVYISLPTNDRNAEVSALGTHVIETRNLLRRGTNPITDCKLLKEYRHLLKTIKPAVVLTYTIKPNVYGGMAATMAKVPYIVNITGLGTAVETPGLLQKITIALYKMGMKGASKIFFQNSANLKFFEKLGIRSDIHALIPGSGVNIEKFSYADYPVSGKIKFLYISRLMKEKGIEEYFDAAEYFGKIHDNLEFHILGDCEEDYSEQLKELEKRGVVIYHGVQKDVRPYLADCSCLIHPTYYPEGMSNVILEACATGRPVITTLRSGCMEIVDDGETGYLFKERDRKALKQSIDKFLSLSFDERVKMGKKARLKVENEFNRQIVVDAYLNEISTIISTT